MTRKGWPFIHSRGIHIFDSITSLVPLDMTKAWDVNKVMLSKTLFPNIFCTTACARPSEFDFLEQ